MRAVSGFGSAVRAIKKERLAAARSFLYSESRIPTGNGGTCHFSKTIFAEHSAACDGSTGFCLLTAGNGQQLRAQEDLTEPVQRQRKQPIDGPLAAPDQARRFLVAVVLQDDARDELAGKGL